MAWAKQLHSLRWRLMLTYVILIVVGFGGLALWAGQQISAGVTQDAERHLEVEALLVASALHEPLEHFYEGEFARNELRTKLMAFNSQTRARITLLDLDGSARLDSTGSVPQTNFSQTPEVIAALSNNVIHDLRDDEQGKPTLYAAAPVVDDYEILGIVHLSVPASEMEAEIFRRWSILAAGVAVMSILALVTSLWLSSSLTQPLSQLRQSALELAGGDLSQRFDQKRADEIGELGTAFNYMAQQVQSMLDEQRAFASNASHELRTPLTTIRLRTELLCSGELDEATTQRYIVEIDEEVTRLNGLVEDLILLSRFEANRVKPGEELIDPARLAKAMQRELEAKATDRQIEMSLVAPDHLPVIQANRNHLHVVFRNLLDNAIKYTPDGGKVQWKLEQENDHLHAIVSDSGRGIAPEDLPHIGKRFFRTDKARTRQVSGIGLGLSLVYLVVEFYGGRLQLNSPGLGKGTTVDVWWPFELRNEAL